MSRVVALVVAVVLVVGAVFARHAIDAGDDDDSGGTTHGNTIHVVCAEELASACHTFDFERRFVIDVEDAAVTADRLVGKDGVSILDVWAVSQPWPAIVDGARTHAGLSPLFGREPTPIGSSQLATVGPSELDACDWKCLGQGGPDGNSTLGGRALDSGVGVLTVGAAASAYFGRSDFATNDLDADFDRWLADFVDATETSTSPVLQLLQSRAFFDVALSFDAEARGGAQSASADRTEGLTLLHPDPPATLAAVVVLAPNVPADDGDDFASSLEQHLTALGWDPASSASTGLPSPGVLTALRDRVSP